MRHTLRIAATGLALAMAIAACSGTPSSSVTLTVLAHDSFDDGVTDETFAAFTRATGIKVEVLAAGDAGAMVTQAVLTKENPLAHVLFGVDDTFLSRALDADIFEPYQANLIETTDPSLRRPDHMVTPINYGDVCINYDRSYFDRVSTPVPVSLDDLRQPELASLLTVLHPATSSPGLAFLLATIDTYGESGYLDFWADLAAGDVEVMAGWTEAYYGSFSQHDGSRPMVVSYASSPPAEVMFADPPTDYAPTGVITAGCYRQVEYAGILTGSDHFDESAQLIDYMLSPAFQEQIPESWFVYPANTEVELPEVFAEHTVLPGDPTRFTTDYIASNRERWINEWIAVMEGR